MASTFLPLPTYSTTTSIATRTGESLASLPHKEASLTASSSNSVFFLYFSGRLHSTETQLDLAVTAFHLAIQAQREYIQLGHICYWCVSPCSSPFLS